MSVASHSEIEKALRDYLIGMPNVPPICWPNRDMHQVRPVLIFDHSVTSRIGNGMDGVAIVQEGFIQVTALVKSGEFATEANSIADQVISRFAPKTKLALESGGYVMIQSTRVSGAGYNDGPDFRLPVVITYRTTG